MLGADVSYVAEIRRLPGSMSQQDEGAICGQGPSLVNNNEDSTAREDDGGAGGGGSRLV